MKHPVLVVVFVAALSTSSAEAEDITIRLAPPLLFSPGASAHIINIPEPLGDAERRARDAAIARWTEHCHPVRYADAEGVIHLSYRYPGCEFGEGE
jgi:hypothetical protein